MTLLILIMIALFVFAGVRAVNVKNRFEMLESARRCRACGRDHPPFANYCGRCGKALQT